MLPHYMMKCPAWRMMSPNSKALLIEVWMRHNGSNNGEISYSVREAEDIGLSRSVAARCFDELVEHGFLRVSRGAGFDQKRMARLWTLTAEPVGEARATKDYMSWVPSGDAPQYIMQSRRRDRQSHLRDYSPPSATILPPTVPPAGLSGQNQDEQQSLPWDAYSIPRGVGNRRAGS